MMSCDHDDDDDQVSIDFISEDNSSPGPSSLRFASVRNRYCVPGMFEELPDMKNKKKPAPASLKRVSIPTIPRHMEHNKDISSEEEESSVAPTIISIRQSSPPPPTPPSPLSDEGESYPESLKEYKPDGKRLSPRNKVPLPEKFVRRNSGQVLELEPLGYENNDGWRTHSDFLFSCFALSLGLPNLWRLSSNAQDSGAYVLIWVLLMFLVGYPLLFLELSLTYFSNKGPLRLWNAVPILKGVGYLQLFISFIYCLYFPVMASYAFFYLSFGLQSSTWENCATPSEVDNKICLAPKSFSLQSISPGEQCFIEEVAHWRSMEDVFSFNYRLLPGLILVYLLALLSIVKGTQTLKRVFWISSSLTLVLLIAFLAYGLSYGDAFSYGLQRFFNGEKWKRALMSPDVWLSAFAQVLLSLHLSCGVLISLGSRTKRYGKYVTLDTSIVFFMNLIIGLLCITMTNAWLGVTRKDSATLQDPAYSTSFLIGLFYDISIATEKEANRWLILALFAVLMFSSAISSLTPIVFSLSSTIDEHVFSPRKKIVVKFSLLFMSFVGSLTLLSSFGLPLIYLLDNYIIVGLVLVASLFFIFGFVFVYGRSTRLESDFTFWTNNDLGLMKILIQMLRRIVPIGLFLGIALFIVALSFKTGECLAEGIWEPGLVWSTFTLGLMILLGFAIKEICIQIDYGLISRIKSAAKCDLNWGPKDPILQHQWHDYMRFEKTQPFAAKLFHNVDKTGIVNLNFSDESSTKF